MGTISCALVIIGNYQLVALIGAYLPTPTREPIVQGIRRQVDEVTKGLGGDLVWPALLRKLDRIDSSYKE